MNPSDPTSADPAATFTYLGAPDSSVKAVLGEVSLPPTMWRNNEGYSAGVWSHFRETIL